MEQENKNRALLNALAKSPMTLLEEGWGSLSDLFTNNGLSLSEDDQNVYVEAHLPGLKNEDIQIKLDGNILWIKGDKKEEKTDKRYHQKAASSFSYKLTVPKDIDPNQEPEAIFENGELKISFKKIPQAKKTKEIPVKKK